MKAGQNDIVFVYAEVTDNNGTLIPSAKDKIDFAVHGDAEIVGLHSVVAEAGIATILLKAGAKPGSIKITASANGLTSKDIIIKSE